VRVATISVTGWREDDIRWSGWSGHARSELSRRLRSSLNLTPAARKEIERQLRAHGLPTLTGIDPLHLETLRHILEATGAQVTVAL